MQWYYAFDFGADAVRMVTASEDDIKFESPFAAFRAGESAPFAWGDRAYAFFWA